MNVLTDEMRADLARVDAWLDSEVSSGYRQQPLAQHWARVAKVAEECGEAVQALIGATGQNPRKGTTHGMDDVLDELADVVFTGLAAIQHFTKDVIATDEILADRLERISKRVPNDTHQ